MIFYDMSINIENTEYESLLSSLPGRVFCLEEDSPFFYFLKVSEIRKKKFKLTNVIFFTYIIN